MTRDGGRPKIASFAKPRHPSTAADWLVWWRRLQGPGRLSSALRLKLAMAGKSRIRETLSGGQAFFSQDRLHSPGRFRLCASVASPVNGDNGTYDIFSIERNTVSDIRHRDIELHLCRAPRSTFISLKQSVTAKFAPSQQLSDSRLPQPEKGQRGTLSEYPPQGHQFPLSAVQRVAQYIMQSDGVHHLDWPDQD